MYYVVEHFVCGHEVVHAATQDASCQDENATLVCLEQHVITI